MVELIPAQKDGKTLVNLINTNEFYYDAYKSGFGEIPPLYDVAVSVRCDRAPKSVTLQPEGTVPDYEYQGGRLWVKIPKLDIHTILVIE